MILNYIKKYKYLILLFLFFILIFSLSPISGDDYGNYVNGYGNILLSFKSAYKFYFSWEGRFIGRILILILTYHKFFWNIITSIMIVLIYYCFVFLNDKKTNVSFYILLFLSIVLLNCDMFAQCYTWVAGSVTYLYPSALVLIYFTYLYRKLKKSNNKVDYLFFIIINIIGTMFVENIGCSLVFGNLLFLIYYFKFDRHKFKFHLFLTLISICSLSIMLLSPGSAIRSASNIAFNNLGLFGKIISNIENFINYYFIRNSFMIILMTIVINFGILKSNKKYKYCIICIINIITFFVCLFNISNYIPIDITPLKNIFNCYLNFSNKYYIIYWGFYLILFVYSIYSILNKKVDKMYFVLFLFIISFVSSFVMLILYTWGDRITFFSTIINSGISVILINQFLNGKISRAIIVLGIFVCIYYCLCFIAIWKINSERIKEIDIQLNENKNEIKVLDNPIHLIWNNNLPGEYFHYTYKKYLDIDANKSLEVYKLRYRDYIYLLFE